jgi:sec-independent protein translocase protein TatA
MGRGNLRRSSEFFPRGSHPGSQLYPIPDCSRSTIRADIETVFRFWIVSKLTRNKAMNFFGIGLPETIAIAVVVLLVFGPKKLPEIGKSLGKAIKGFQEASNDFQSEFRKEVDAIESAVNSPSKLESSEAIETKSEHNS